MRLSQALALTSAALALVCRLAPHLPFHLAIAVSPQLHRAIPLGTVLF